MSLAKPFLLAILAAQYICMGSADMERPTTPSIYEPQPHMLELSVKKTKDGWNCASVFCPKGRTASCKVTQILKPTLKIEHDLVVLCLDERNKPFCGTSQSSRVIYAEEIELDEVTNDLEYITKERLKTSEGHTVPHCPVKRRKSLG